MFLRYLGTLTSWTDAIECLSSQFQYHKEVWWSIDIFRLFSISSEATVNFIVFEGIEIDLETSILSNGITAEYYCTMEKLSNRDLPEQHLILPAIPMLIALIWCRNVSFNYKKPQDEYRLGEKVLIFVNRSVTDSTWWQT